MAPASSRPSAFKEGLAIQSRVVAALVVREMMTRYGRANLGFFWVVIEPILLTAGVMLVWSLIKSPYEHGVQVVSFVLTGYMPLTLWRHMTNAGVFAFRRSMGLLYHRHVSLIDALMARMILEFAGTTTALLIVYLVLVLANVIEPFHDPGLALMGWLSMGVLSLGVGFNFAVMTEYSEVSERFIQPIQYLMLPLSGAFFLVGWLPKEAQDLALLNPTVHCYEMFRSGLFGPSVETTYSVWYPLVCAAALLAIALSTIDAVRDRLHTG